MPSPVLEPAQNERLNCEIRNETLCYLYYHLSVSIVYLLSRAQNKNWTRKSLLLRFGRKLKQLPNLSNRDFLAKSFLNASSHLYNRVCPSIRLSVGLSVRLSVGDAFVKNKENQWFRVYDCKRKYTRQISYNHIIILSVHHHEDASLALWALFLIARREPLTDSLCVEFLNPLWMGGLVENNSGL